MYECPGLAKRRLHRPIAMAALAVLALMLVGRGMPAWAGAALPVYQTKYYELHSDLDEQNRQEATLRVTLMAEEYHRRTQGLAGTVKERLPLYLYKDHAEYVAAGGRPDSAGYFNGVRLEAAASPTNPDRTWHVVQHEGFHQFIHAAVGDGLPVWANEGLAEYFGEGVFTGDQFLVGFIPPDRLARIQQWLSEGKDISLRGMMAMNPELWNSALHGQYYDMAWSMVQFLGHAENGKYQNAFMGFLRDVSQRTDPDKAWAKNFGTDVAAFQQRWEEYWRKLPANPTQDLYDQATMSTITSFYARALSQRQKFDTPDDFFTAAKAGELKGNPKNWLPPRLLASALEKAADMGEWTFKGKGAWRPLFCTTRDGALLEGQFKIEGGQVRSVNVEVRNKRK